MGILDPKLGGKIRAATVIASFIVVILTSPQVVDLGWSWAAPVASGIAGFLQLVTHFTGIGNKSP